MQTLHRVGVSALLLGVAQLSPAEVSSAPSPVPGESTIVASTLRDDLTSLASDASAGRGTSDGTLESSVTGYVEGQWRLINAEPAGDRGTYRQGWTYVPWGIGALSGFARPATAHDTSTGDEDEADGEARAPDGERRWPRFGTAPNQEGLAFSPKGEPASVEPLPPGLGAIGPLGPNTHNLVAKISGSDPSLKDEYIIIGAHLDHLGLRSGTGDTIYNGADDNGSGSATLLSISRAVAAARDAGHGPSRTVVFILFSGEEKGLLGSQFFVRNPTVPLDKVKGMINIDMLGRESAAQLSIYDLGKSGGANLFHSLHDSSGLGFTQLNHNISAYLARSDQYPFYTANIPIVFFFEGFTPTGGLNPDYHRVTDHVDKVGFDKLQSAGRFVLRHLMNAAGFR